MIQFHCLKGAHLRILQQQKARNRDICLIHDKSAYATSQMCPLKQLCAPSHGSRGSHFKGPGLRAQSQLFQVETFSRANPTLKKTFLLSSLHFRTFLPGFANVVPQAMSCRCQRAQKWRDTTTLLRDYSAFPKEGDPCVQHF